MAWMRSEVNASSASNVTLTVGIEIGSVSRSGTSVSIYYRAYAYTSGSWTKNSIALWVNNERNLVFNSDGGANHNTIGTKYYTNYYTTTKTVGATTSSTNVTIGVANTTWAAGSVVGNFDVYIDGLPTASTPVGVWASHSDVTRTSASLSGGYSYIGDYVGYSWQSFDWGTSTSYGNSGQYPSNLTPNTTYYYKYTVCNTAGLSNYATGSFKTTGNAPNITSVSTSPSRTGCSFTINVDYDTNDSFSSRRIDYGTSTDYGSYVTGTSISSLEANTTYYYKVTINSSQGRSKTYTGSFITTGNAPSITSSTPQSGNPSRTSYSFDYVVNYDTNAGYNSIENQWGTSTSYGDYNNTNEISNLSPNTKYYHRFRITDNFGRTSDWYTDEFTTIGNIPTISDGSITNLKSKTCTLSVTDNYDTNAEFSSMIIKLYLNDILQDTFNCSSNTKNIENLKPGKNYVAKVTITDNWNRTSSEYSITFKTKGGFKFNGKMSDSIKINGKEVIGMKYNGIEII